MKKGYQLLFGDKAVKERLIGILLCVIAAVYSASGVLGTEYDLKVMNLLRSTKRGAERIIFKKAWRVIRNYSGDLCFSQNSGDIKSCRGVSAGMLGRKGAFDDVCGTVGYKLFDLRIRFDADDYAACDIVCHCI